MKPNFLYGLCTSPAWMQPFYEPVVKNDPGYLGCWVQWKYVFGDLAYVVGYGVGTSPKEHPIVTQWANEKSLKFFEQISNFFQFFSNMLAMRKNPKFFVWKMWDWTFSFLRKFTSERACLLYKCYLGCWVQWKCLFGLWRFGMWSRMALARLLKGALLSRNGQMEPVEIVFEKISKFLFKFFFQKCWQFEKIHIFSKM